MTPEQKTAFLRSRDINWVDRINLDGKVTGIFADYKYVGTGDTGGATNEDSVRILEATVTKGKTTLPTPLDLPASDSKPNAALGEGPVRGHRKATRTSCSSDIEPGPLTARLPSYKGDLETHPNRWVSSLTL